jgi:hypothetical protein
MAITVACQRFIDEFLKPRFLPVICPTEFNYPIDILQVAWHTIPLYPALPFWLPRKPW